MQTNYILIDFENVQPTILPLLDHAQVKIVLFVGSNQTKIAFEVAAALQSLGSRAEYVKISGSGPNALDFHIAFYVGQLSAREPNAAFHIISHDTGFDPLVQHLRSKQVQIWRWEHLTASPFLKGASPLGVVKAAKVKVASPHLAAIVTDLQRRGTAKPATIATLTRTIAALFRKQLSEADVTALVQALQTHGIITVKDKRVSYSLPSHKSA